jgi:hypothetical protein
MPLFNLVSNGIEPLQVYYQYALTNGSSSQREAAARGS